MKTEALRTVIVDDEPLARDCVRLALARIPGIDVVAECADGQAAIDAITENEPDLVFLDVQMTGVDGFDVIRTIGVDAMPPVVFVTAFDRHALRAFEVHALDYVMKPFDDARFEAAVQHARRFVEGGMAGDVRERLKDMLAERSTDAEVHLERLTVRERDRIRLVRVDDVDWFESAGNYVRIHAGDASYLIRRTLTSIDEALDPAKFTRIHRSTVVNVDRIAELRPAQGGDYVAVLRDGRRLRVSRAYRDSLIG